MFCKIFRLTTFLLFFAILCLPASAANYSYALSTFGGLKYPSSFRNFDYVNPNAPKKGEVTFGVDGGFNNLNQFILNGISASGLSYLYDSLMEGSADEISSYYPLVAKMSKLSDDKKEMEFLLNQNAYFHDKKQITADDVVFSFNILVSKGHPSYKIAFKDVKKVEKINKFHVKFTFKNNNNRDLPALVASLPVLPKHYYENNKFDQTTLSPPLGSGPYKVSDVQANHSITYERVKDYWAKDLSVNRGRYNFDKITYDYYHDSNVLVEAFKSGKYDLRQENVARNWANSYNIDAIKQNKIIKQKIKHQLPAPMQAFVINLRKSKFQDIALRKALSYAFDFEWLKKHIFYGSYERTNSFFSNSDFGYENFKLPVSNGDGYNRTNLVEAKNILENAGYKVKEFQLVDKNNNKIEIEFLISQKSFEMIIAPFIKNLKKLGIDAKLKFVEENQYKTRVNNYDFDIVVGMFGQALVPGNELYSYFHSSQKDVKGARNLAGIDNKKVDYIIEKIIKATSASEIKALCGSLDKILLENYYVIPQWYNDSYRVLYKNIFGMPKAKPKYSLAVDSWWIKQN